MPDEKTLSVLVGCYESPQRAVEDFETIRSERAEHYHQTWDAAVVERSADGAVRVSEKYESNEVFGFWSGAGIAGVVGLLFPPAMLGLGLIAGGAVGAVAGHLMRGLSRHDLKVLGDALDSGEAALVVVAEDDIADEMRVLMSGATGVTTATAQTSAAAIAAAMKDAGARGL